MRSQDQILALVQEKADAMRRRRRRIASASGGATAALLLVIGIAAMATTGDTNDRVVTADGGIGSADSTTTSSSPSTTATPTSTAVEPSHSTTTPSQSSPELSDDPRPEVSEAPTTTTPPPPPPCPASTIEMTVTTDRSTYTTGEEVVLTAVGTNKAGHDCAEADSSETVIRDHEGRQVYALASIAARTEGDWRWRAGETRTSQQQWNQTSITEDGQSPVPPGTYTVTMSWTAANPDSGDRVTYASSANFTIEEP